MRKMNGCGIDALFIIGSLNGWLQSPTVNTALSEETEERRRKKKKNSISFDGGTILIHTLLESNEKERTSLSLSHS